MVVDRWLRMVGGRREGAVTGLAWRQGAKHQGVSAVRAASGFRAVWPGAAELVGEPTGTARPPPSWSNMVI